MNEGKNGGKNERKRGKQRERMKEKQREEFCKLMMEKQGKALGGRGPGN